VPIYVLKAKHVYSVREIKNINRLVYIDKCQYEIQEQKEVPVWYTGIYRPISRTAYRLLLRLPNAVVEWLTLVLYDREVPGLNLGPETGYLD
jgi:hypothetical protein